MEVAAIVLAEADKIVRVGGLRMQSSTAPLAACRTRLEQRLRSSSGRDGVARELVDGQPTRQQSGRAQPRATQSDHLLVVLGQLFQGLHRHARCCVTFGVVGSSTRLEIVP